MAILQSVPADPSCNFVFSLAARSRRFQSDGPTSRISSARLRAVALARRIEPSALHRPLDPARALTVRQTTKRLAKELRLSRELAARRRKVARERIRRLRRLQCAAIKRNDSQRKSCANLQRARAIRKIPLHTKSLQIMICRSVGNRLSLGKLVSHAAEQTNHSASRLAAAPFALFRDEAADR